jgi:glycosyltransferase involved in cell wall biosynthesis
MRILLLSRFFWPSAGGHTTVLRDLAHAWVEQGHEVDVVTSRHDDALAERERIDGVDVLRLRTIRRDYVGIVHFVWNLRRYLASKGSAYDAICVSMLKHCAFAAVRYRRPGTPVVLRTEGGGETGDVAWQNRARFGASIRRHCRAADAIVALTPEIETELIESGYDRRKLRRIANGVRVPAEPWCSTGVTDRRRAVGLADRPTVVFTGRLVRQKGLFELIDALGSPGLRRRDVQLVVVGDGKDRAAIEQHASDRSVSDAVVFTGQVTDVEPYLRAADLFVLPSYFEGMSRSILESLALGLPSLASDIEANRQLAPESILRCVPVRDGAALAEAIEALLADGATRDRDAVEARRAFVAGRFGITSIATRYLELFTELGRGEADSRGTP